MVFQSFNLFPQYTALENVTLARELMAKNNGESREDIRSAGMELLSQMGLVDRANHYPHQLSGGPAAAGSHCTGLGAAPGHSLL